MEQKYIENGELKARVCVWGSVNNPKIVCLHGLGSTNLSFIELADDLKDKYYVISIDLPGHGRTPAFKNEADYSMPNIINWLSNIIDIFIKDDFYLIGHSWGGDIALHFATEHPIKVKKIVLLDGGFQNRKELYNHFSNTDVTKYDYAPISLEEDIKNIISDANKYIYSTLKEAIEDEKEGYSRWSDLLEVATKDLIIESPKGVFRWCTSPEVEIRVMKSICNYPPSLIYDRLETPILLLRSTKPEVWNEVRDLMMLDFKKRVKNHTVKKIDESHMLHWDNPGLVLNEIREFLG